MTSVMTCRARRVAAFLACAVTPVASASVITVTYDEPVRDRWMYPFNPTPGIRSAASTFATYNEPDFDNRDGQFIIGFDTVADVVPGLSFSSYEIVSVRLTLQNDQDNVFIYDNTQDSYTVLLDPGDPEYVAGDDPGQPLELYGLGYRNNFNIFAFTEDGPYSIVGPFGQQIRNAYAIDFDATGAPIDIALSVDQRFDPSPWAIGQIATVTPGSTVPIDQFVTFDVDVANPNVQGYFRKAMHDGRLNLCLTSLTVVEQQGGEFPSFYTKESALVELGITNAAQLELDVVVIPDTCPEDIDGSGDVGFGDILAIIGNWGPCIGCLEDLTGDGDVGFGDILAVIAAWGVCQ
ncbi:MAG: hypothetical protein ACYTGP_00855 [Planctomycetota bacterium]|jgi:hypothetical protein